MAGMNASVKGMAKGNPLPQNFCDDGGKKVIDKTMPYFALVRLGRLKPYGKWFSLQCPDGRSVCARKLLPETVTVQGYAGLNEKGQMEFEGKVNDEEAHRVGEEFVRRCHQESDPFLYALACAMQPLDPDGQNLRWLEVNPIDGSFVVHTLLVELDDGERLVLPAHQVVWEEG